jgi:phage tail sheath gpL-like
MTSVPATNYAATYGQTVRNIAFSAALRTLPRRVLIVGTYDDINKTDITPDTLYPVDSAAQVGADFGRGFMLHRLAMALERGGPELEMWVVPQLNEPSPTPQRGAGTIRWTDTGLVGQSGEIAIYIGSDRVLVSIGATDDAIEIAGKATDAVNASLDLPVYGEDTGNGQLNVYAKDLGAWGGQWTIPLAVGRRSGDFNPAQASVVVNAMGTPFGGFSAGRPDIQKALDLLGSGDSQNEHGFTAIVHGYWFPDFGVPYDWDVNYDAIDKIAAWNEDNYIKTVARPVRSLIVYNGTDDDVTSGDALAELQVGTATRFDDRTNGIVVIPGSPTNPAEAAATAIGVLESISATEAGTGYVGETLPGVEPGVDDDLRFTDDYDTREAMVRTGLSPTTTRGGAVQLQNVMTFHNPANISFESDGYKTGRNIAIFQNFLTSLTDVFSGEAWQGISIVEDVSRVSNPTSRAKVRDLKAVRLQLISIVEFWGRESWVYDAAFTVSRLQSDPTLIQIRPGGTGFSTQLPVVLSGESSIIDNLVEFDVSFGADL